MGQPVIVLHSPLSPAEFEARFREWVGEDAWWGLCPGAWFAGDKDVLGRMDGESFTLRRRATYSRRNIQIFIFSGKVSADARGGTRVEGYFDLNPAAVVLSRVLGIGGGLLLFAEYSWVWRELRDGTVLLNDVLPQFLMPAALVAYGIFFPAVARMLAGGSEAFLLDFMRKNLLAQSDAEPELPILDSAMR